MTGLWTGPNARRTVGALALPLLMLPSRGGAQEGERAPPTEGQEVRLAETLPLLRLDSLVSTETSKGVVSLPTDWEEVLFAEDSGVDRATGYIATSAGGRPAICSMSVDGASALVMEVEYDPFQYPILRFWLRVSEVVSGGDIAERKGDDFAARIFVNFRFDSSQEGVFSRFKHTVAEKHQGRVLPGHALNYVWGNKAHEGTEVKSAYTDRVQMIVVRSGARQHPTWHLFERNIVEDYASAFEKMAPQVTSIGIMSDSDDTGNLAAACFGEITALPTG